MTDLALIRGNTRTLDIAATDPAGGPADLTGSLALVFTAARSPRGEVVMTKSLGAGVTITNAVAGLASITILPTDWATYIGDPVLVWDVESTAEDGTVTTVASGRLLVDQIVNRDVFLVAQYTYVPATPIGQLRLYIDDRDMSQIDPESPLETRSAIFTDVELSVFLGSNLSIPYLAAAEALTVIAGNRSLLVQSRRIGNTTVDYGNARADLLRQAAAFRELYNTQVGTLAPADGIAEIAYDDFAMRRIITNSGIRKWGG